MKPFEFGGQCKVKVTWTNIEIAMITSAHNKDKAVECLLTLEYFAHNDRMNPIELKVKVLGKCWGALCCPCYQCKMYSWSDQELNNIFEKMCPTSFDSTVQERGSWAQLIEGQGLGLYSAAEYFCKYITY